MKTSIAHSANLSQCLAQLESGISSPPRLIVFFTSACHKPSEVGSAFARKFPDAAVIGCSTAGEISSGKMSEHSIVAMAIPKALLANVATAFIDDPNDPAEVGEALESIAARFGKPLRDLDPATHAGIVIVDGLSLAEERLMDKLGDFTDFPFVGGSAGDDLAFHKTFVSLDGSVSDHGAVIAVLELPNGYQIVKTQSFRSTGRYLTATNVDPATRTVIEFDGQPASKAYAQALGIPPDQLAAEFVRHPLGLVIDGEPYVRSPQRVEQNGSIVFYCNVLEGMELDILDSTDIIGDTRRALAESRSRLEFVAGLINFDCILRTLELRAKKACENYGRLFDDISTIGFSTYGEEYLGHLNQTATMLMLGAPK